MLMYKLKQSIDVSPLFNEVIENNDSWGIYTDRQRNIRVQQETSYIPLTTLIPEPGKRINDWQFTKKTSLYEKFPVINKFLNDFINEYGGELALSMIVRLPSEKMVHPHVDLGSYYRFRDRFHLVLSGMYNYVVGDQEEIFKAGELWWFDNNVLHSATTLGAQDRISIIFDVKDSNWKKIMLLE